ncbi:OmpA family protein [Planctomycetota bacterium]|nr:OmpA family protein [Planctomycetota bacterium]
MKSFARLAMAAILLGSVGCAAQSEVDQYRNLYRKSEAQQIELQSRLDEANARILALQAAPKVDLEAKAALEAALAEKAQMEAALAEAKERIRDLATTSSQLPVALSNKLENLAARNPSLMSYDADSGMVRLASDLTFDLGKTTVKSGAVGSLQQLAVVLNSAEAMSYEVRVVGHTDNVPVKNAANKAKFGDNWGLSAGRAIAVKDVLQKSGIAPTRMNISGYGEYRPIALNDAAKGSQANRRVEIFLVMMQEPIAAAPVAAPIAKPVNKIAVPAVKPAEKQEDKEVFYK